MADNREAVFQFDLRAVLVLMAFVALACAGFAMGTQGWVHTFHVLTLVLLGGGLVASVGSTGSRRIFWFSLVVFTSLYLAATYRKLEFLGLKDGVPTSEWVDDLAASRYPNLKKSLPQQNMFGQGFYFDANPRRGPASEVGFQAVAIAFGLLAAYVSRAVYVLSARREAKKSEPEAAARSEPLKHEET